MSEDFNFWKMAYTIKAIDIELLKQAVKCDKNPYGEITKDEYRIICGEEFKETVSLF